MNHTHRRNMLRLGLAFVAAPSMILHAGCGAREEPQAAKNENPDDSADKSSGVAQTTAPTNQGNSMKIQYLEIVTPDVEGICKIYSQAHGVEFGEGDESLGGARTAKLANGGMLGVRAPMHEAEKPVVRNYVVVEDIQATFDSAVKSGAKALVPPMKLGEHGTCAIVMQGEIEFGFWQV